MCGIVGTSWSKKARDFIMNGLKALEYRGYDSAGIFFRDSKRKGLYRTTERIEGLKTMVPQFGEATAIGHTRWATHGGVSNINAHPQVSYDGKVHVVHNGVISNYRSVRAEMMSRSIPFVSETDTEVIANFFADLRNQGFSGLQALRLVTEKLHGQMALLLVDEREEKTVYFVKIGSPLLLGRSGSSCFFASDQLPMSGFASEIADIPDGTYGQAGPEEIQAFCGLEKVELKFTTLASQSDSIDLKGYPHYMLKEIEEEPEALQRLNTDLKQIRLSEALALKLKNSPIIMLGCGTSYNACLYAADFLKTNNNTVTVKIASEFSYETETPENSLFILVSQSGETYDLIKCLSKIRAGKNNYVLALVNSKRSTIAKSADYVIDLKAGQEIAVASTKVYMNEVLAIYALGNMIQGQNSAKITDDLVDRMKEVKAHREDIEKLASKTAQAGNGFFVGRGRDMALALESSLKLKEVSYIHSEAAYAGELKHGPIALIDSDFLTVFIITNPDCKEITESNISEVRARGGKVIVLSTVDGFAGIDGYSLRSDNPLAGLILVMWAQYFSYYAALARVRNVDKPRNLAKSVTVE